LAIDRFTFILYFPFPIQQGEKDVVVEFPVQVEIIAQQPFLFESHPLWVFPAGSRQKRMIASAPAGSVKGGSSIRYWVTAGLLKCWKTKFAVIEAIVSRAKEQLSD
jgi:hypothetical protein